MIVTLAGIDLTGTWSQVSLTDWWGLPASRTDATPKPSSSGAFTPSRTLRDVVRPSAVLRRKFADESEAAAAVELLNATVGAGLVSMVVDDGRGPTSRLVEVQGVQVSSGFEWWNLPVAVDTIAFDPFRYGPESCSSTGLPVAGSGAVWPAGPDGSGTAGGYVNWGSAGVSGRVVVANAGSAVAYPVLTVSGGGFSSSGFELVEVESGRRLTFAREVVDGSVIRFDGRSRRVSVDGQSDVTGALSSAEWPSIPAGGSRSFQFLSLGASSGAPSLQVCVAPAYL